MTADPERIHCTAYLKHRSDHRWVADGWFCPRCEELHVRPVDDTYSHDFTSGVCGCGAVGGLVTADGRPVVRHRRPPVPRRNTHTLAGPLPDLSSPDWRRTDDEHRAGLDRIVEGDRVPGDG